MDHATHERIETLELLVKTILEELRESRSEFKAFQAKVESFIEEQRAQNKQTATFIEEQRVQNKQTAAFIEEQRAQNKQTATLLRTFGARVHGIEGRVGALESRLEVVESTLA